MEITSYILPDNNARKLKIDSQQISSKYTNSWRLRNLLLNDEGQRGNQGKNKYFHELN